MGALAGAAQVGLEVEALHAADASPAATETTLGEEWTVNSHCDVAPDVETCLAHEGALKQLDSVAQRTGSSLGAPALDAWASCVRPWEEVHVPWIEGCEEDSTQVAPATEKTQHSAAET